MKNAPKEMPQYFTEELKAIIHKLSDVAVLDVSTAANAFYVASKMRSARSDLSALIKNLEKF